MFRESSLLENVQNSLVVASSVLGVKAFACAIHNRFLLRNLDSELSAIKEVTVVLGPVVAFVNLLAGGVVDGVLASVMLSFVGSEVGEVR